MECEHVQPNASITGNHSDSYIKYLIDDELGTLKVGMVRMTTDKYSSPMKQLEDMLYKIVSEDRPDILMMPEYSFTSSPPLTKNEKDDLVERLGDATKDSDTLMIPGSMLWEESGALRNTSVMLYKGAVLFEYDKRVDGGEHGIASRFGLKPHYGKKKGVFEWRGRTCGIELCADHSTLSSEGVKDLDLQFLVSCGMHPHEDYIRIKEGGYLLYCDGDAPKAEIRKRKKLQLFDYVKPVGDKV